MLTEHDKNAFKEHKAALHDFGMIKVLNFAVPGSSYYRIRFLFEEDRYEIARNDDYEEMRTPHCPQCGTKLIYSLAQECS